MRFLAGPALTRRGLAPVPAARPLASRPLHLVAMTNETARGPRREKISAGMSLAPAGATRGPAAIREGRITLTKMPTIRSSTESAGESMSLGEVSREPGDLQDIGGDGDNPRLTLFQLQRFKVIDK